MKQNLAQAQSVQQQKNFLFLAGGMLGLTALFVTIMIRTGFTNPQPIGDPIWQQGTVQITAPVNGRHHIWLQEELPQGNFSIRMILALQDGEQDSGAGFILANEENRTIVAISPLGYATIQQEQVISCQLPVASCNQQLAALFPWQPWPHVRTNGQPNEIWIDIEDEALRVRVNRELLWVGQAPNSLRRVGVVGESFGGTAVFTFQKIELLTKVE